MEQIIIRGQRLLSLCTRTIHTQCTIRKIITSAHPCNNRTLAVAEVVVVGAAANADNNTDIITI